MLAMVADGWFLISDVIVFLLEQFMMTSCFLF